MTENQLIKHGFKKQTCSDLESGNGYDYYYYILTVPEKYTFEEKKFFTL